jgi:hypothetical protein
MFFADLPINDPERGSLRLRDRLTSSQREDEYMRNLTPSTRGGGTPSTVTEEQRGR